MLLTNFVALILKILYIFYASSHILWRIYCIFNKIITVIFYWFFLCFGRGTSVARRDPGGSLALSESSRGYCRSWYDAEITRNRQWRQRITENFLDASKMYDWNDEIIFGDIHSILENLMKRNGLHFLNFRIKTNVLLFGRQNFLFLFSLCLAELNIFIWFTDIWDVAMNVSIAVIFFGVWQCRTLYFNLLNEKSL